MTLPDAPHPLHRAPATAWLKSRLKGSGGEEEVRCHFCSRLSKNAEA